MLGVRERSGFCCSLLVEEGKKVAHHDEERTWEGGKDQFNLGGFLHLLLNFWTIKGKCPKLNLKNKHLIKSFKVLVS